MAKTVNPGNILVYIGHNPDNALGENIIKLPFLRAIRQAFPDARVSPAGRRRRQDDVRGAPILGQDIGRPASRPAPRARPG